ncbi:MAG: CotH kinase family protein [Deltaproteobacteria bacterium]|nr:CotH kinase family protein [Deltaproteobacteria bacterium]
MPVEGVLLINEVMSDNESTLQNDDDTLPDWIELYNPGTVEIDLTGVRLADDSGVVWEGGAGQVQPGGTYVLFADETNGRDHLGFSVSSSGEVLKVMVGVDITDEIVVPALPSDVSWQRFPDGSDVWSGTADPTPGWSNTEPSVTLDPVDSALSDGMIHQIEWELTTAQYDILNSSAESWAWAEATIDGIHYDQIDVRLKGSASFDTMEGKPQFKVDLNQYDPEARWQNLKGFNLHNGNVLDPTRTRDYLSYQLARESGLMAPRVGWAELYVNGNYYGIYMMIEDYDNKMIESSFPGQGDLGAMFEPNESPDGGWGGGDFCQGTPSFDYEEGPVPMDPLVANALNEASRICGRSATDENVLLLWDHVDKEGLLTYMAWETLIQHGDGYKSPNNWRVYVDTSYKVHLVPAGAEWTWDYTPATWSFGGDLANWCLLNRGCKEEYALEVLEMADRVETLDLYTQFTDLTAWLDPIIDLDTRSPHSDNEVSNARASTSTRLQDNPNDVRRDVEDTFPGLAASGN